MQAKEKAEELVNRYLQVYHGRVKVAKQCALICQQKVIDSLNELKDSEHSDAFWLIELKILEEVAVKQQIETL